MKGSLSPLMEVIDYFVVTSIYTYIYISTVNVVCSLCCGCSSFCQIVDVGCINHQSKFIF